MDTNLASKFIGYAFIGWTIGCLILVLLTFLAWLLVPLALLLLFGRKFLSKGRKKKPTSCDSLEP